MSSAMPLRILVCEAQQEHAEQLVLQLKSISIVQSVAIAASIPDAQQQINDVAFDIVIIDPLSFNLDDASNWVFDVRKEMPDIVFILFVDANEVERNRVRFFQGERSRFGHYYTLDRRSSPNQFQQDLEAILLSCQEWQLSVAGLHRLRRELPALVRGGTQAEQVSVTKGLEEAIALIQDPHRLRVKPRTVFVSYSFKEADYIGGMRRLLEQRGLEVVTGDRARDSISAAIIERIKKSAVFLSLMTKHRRTEDGGYTASAWLLEEKGAALALSKPMVLMVEEGVDDIGGLQGDWQRIHFRPTSFLAAALDAVEQIASYTGLGREGS